MQENRVRRIVRYSQKTYYINQNSKSFTMNGL